MTMTDERWQPLGMDANEAGSLFEDMTPWLAESFWAWVTARFSRLHATSAPYGGRSNSYSFRTDRLRDFERACRIRVEYTGVLVTEGMQYLRTRVTEKKAEFRLADYLVKTTDDKGSSAALDRMLHEAGSVWTVGTRASYPGLERRVPAGVQGAAEQAMATPGHAGTRLSEAWHAVYGVGPNPTHGYAMAVKAVEDAAVPIVVPKQAEATLGHVIGQLRQDGDWSLPLTREDPSAPTAETVLRLCQALWKGHHDRHGGDASAAQSVGHKEAEAAVQIAVLLVHGFATGMIARQ